VLLDISLPGMDGFEVLRRLRERSAMPAVALTAHAMAGDRKRFLDAGFAEHVAKPITDPGALRSLIERLLAV
jgi:two-component system sensor histidine kinase/response regulator